MSLLPWPRSVRILVRTFFTTSGTRVVEALDALLVIGKYACSEVRTNVAHRCKSIDCRVKTTHLPRVEFVHGGIVRNNNLSRSSTVSDKNRHRCIGSHELSIIRNR